MTDDAPPPPSQPPPLDPWLAGPTEALSAQSIGIGHPLDESAEASGLDALFADSQFRDILGAQPTGAMVALAAAEPPLPPEKRARGGVSRSQRILLWIAGSLVAVLALFALFLLGTRLAGALGPAPALSPSPSPSPTPTPTLPVVLPAGPLAPGVYDWLELLGGECIEPYLSPWVEDFTVVDCTVPHGAQMVHRGVFPDLPEAPYPGIEELQARVNLLCTPPTIIDYAVAGFLPDVQVTASFAATEQEWAEGHRTYFCFVHRGSGEPLTASIAVPQPPPAG